METGNNVDVRWTEELVMAIGIGTELEYLGYTATVVRIIGKGIDHNGNPFKVVEAQYRGDASITTGFSVGEEMGFLRAPEGGIKPLDINTYKSACTATAYMIFGRHHAAYTAAEIVVSWRQGDLTEGEANNEIQALKEKYGCLSRRHIPTVRTLHSMSGSKNVTPHN